MSRRSLGEVNSTVAVERYHRPWQGLAGMCLERQIAVGQNGSTLYLHLRVDDECADGQADTAGKVISAAF